MHPGRIRKSLMIAAALSFVACGPSQPADSPTGSSTGPAMISPTASPPPGPTPAPASNVVTAERIATGIPLGEYQLDAYIIELRPCPECPPPLSCKPCIGDQVAVHDVPSPSPDMVKPMLLLGAGQIAKLEQGKRYHFMIRAVGQPGGTTVNHIEVISAQPIP